MKGILYTAMLMGEARGDCTDEEWRQVVEELPFGIRHAQMLIKIGLDPRLTRHVSLMPSDIRTMYQLTRLSIPRYDELLESGVRRFEKRGIFQRQSHAWWLWVSSAVVD